MYDGKNQERVNVGSPPARNEDERRGGEGGRDQERELMKRREKIESHLQESKVREVAIVLLVRKNVRNESERTRT